MLIGITGRGGSGKSTVARLIQKDNPEFSYIDVDSLVETKVLKSESLLSKVNLYFDDKKYTIEDIIMSYFKTDAKSKKIHGFFVDEVENVLYDEISFLSSDNVIIDWFLLHEMSSFKNMDIKILTTLDKTERIRRVSSRKKTEDINLFILIDNCYNDNYCCEFNYIINTENDNSINNVSKLIFGGHK